MLNILSDESFTTPIRLRRNNFGNELEDPINFPKKIKTQITNTCGTAINFIPVVFTRQQSHLLYSQYVEEYNLKQHRGVDLLFDGNGNIDLEGYEIYRFVDYIEKLENVFRKGKIIYVRPDELKSEFVSSFMRPLFIDNEFPQRLDVRLKSGIPCLDVDQIQFLQVSAVSDRTVN